MQCSRCHREFVKTGNRQIFCSPKCRFGEATCTVCGTVFICTKHTTGLFCSKKCWYKAYDASNIRTCRICGSAFNGNPDRKYCSYPCAHIGHRTAKRNTHCFGCGKCLRYAATNPRKKFCSKSCASTYNNNGRRDTRPDGSKQRHSSGYMRIKIQGKWPLEHRYQMELTVGRPLEKHERVHHKNGNRSDNRPENLELWKVKTKDPPGVRATDYHCPGCHCGVQSTFSTGDGI